MSRVQSGGAGPGLGLSRGCAGSCGDAALRGLSRLSFVLAAPLETRSPAPSSPPSRPFLLAQLCATGDPVPGSALVSALSLPSRAVPVPLGKRYGPILQQWEDGCLEHSSPRLAALVRASLWFSALPAV